MNIHRGAGSLFGSTPSSQPPIDAPNTLQTVATARAVFLVSEGVCGGLANGLQSIYFDDTPVQNPDGSFNNQNISVDFRLGVPDQTPLTGFPAVENETPVGTPVVLATPIVRSITDAAATRARVTIGFTSLVKIDASNGNTYPGVVTFAIDVQPFGQLYSTLVVQTIEDKTTSPQQLSFSVDLTGIAPWNIRVRRISPDSPQSQGSVTQTSPITWVSYTTIEDYRLKYDNSAVVGITFDANTTGGRVPTVSFDWIGTATQVPVNFDPIARTYTGIWDGTFKLAFHSDPAWWFWALATHKRFGLGELVEASYTDKWALYAISQWCSGRVPDGKGGTEPRLSFNAQINTADDAIKALTTLASTFWGQVYWGAGGLMATADMPALAGDRKKLVVAANTIDGHIEYTESQLKTQHSIIAVTWYDPANFCKATVETVEDRTRIARWGRRIKQVVKQGCTSQSEAHRFGLWVLETEASDEIAAWSASWDQADFLPGELAYIADRTIAGLRMGGRLAGTVTTVGITGVILDAPVTLNVGETYTLSVVMPDGTIYDIGVTTPPSTTATLSFATALPQTPVAGAVWVLTSTALAPRPFRLISRGENAKNIFPLVAQEHDPTKYLRIERNISLPNPPFTSLKTGPLTGPTNLTVTEALAQHAGTIHDQITVSWTAANDTRVTLYQVQMRAPGVDWKDAPGSPVAGVSLDIWDLTAGTYGFRVRSLDAFLRVSPTWLTLETFNSIGLYYSPPSVTSFTAVYQPLVTDLSWIEVTDSRPTQYEIRKGTSWDSGTIIGRYSHPPVPALGDGIYWINTVVLVGKAVYALTPVALNLVGSVLPLNVKASWDEFATGVQGTLTGLIYDGVEIRTYGTTDILTAPDVYAIGDVGDSTVTISIATPGVVTWNAHGLGADQNVRIATSGALPTGLTALATYFVVNPTANTFQLAATAGGAAINTTGSQSGVHRAYAGGDLFGFGVQSNGNYEIPTSHQVDVGYVAPCLIAIFFTSAGVSVTQNFFAYNPLFDVLDFFGALANQNIDVHPEIALSQDGVTWGPWKTYQAGVYNARKFKARMLVLSNDPATTAFLTSFVFSVYVPTRVDNWAIIIGVRTSLDNVLLPAAGRTLTFLPDTQLVAAPFNGGVSNPAQPVVLVTIMGWQPGDIPVVSALTLSGCTVQVQNAGIGVVRNVNIRVEGY